MCMSKVTIISNICSLLLFSFLDLKPVWQSSLPRYCCLSLGHMNISLTHAASSPLNISWFRETKQPHSDSFNGRCPSVSRDFKRYSIISWIIPLCGTSEIIRLRTSSHNTIWLKDRGAYVHSFLHRFCRGSRENHAGCKNFLSFVCKRLDATKRGQYGTGQPQIAHLSTVYNSALSFCTEKWKSHHGIWNLLKLTKNIRLKIVAINPSQFNRVFFLLLNFFEFFPLVSKLNEPVALPKCRF